MDYKAEFPNLNAGGVKFLAAYPVLFTQKSWGKGRGSCFAHCVRWVSGAVKSNGVTPAYYFEKLRRAGAKAEVTEFGGRRAYLVMEEDGADDKTRRLQEFFMSDEIKGSLDSPNLQGVNAASQIEEKMQPSLKNLIKGGSSFRETQDQQGDPLQIILDHSRYMYCIHSMSRHADSVPMDTTLTLGMGPGSKLMQKKKKGHAVATMRFGRGQHFGLFDPNVGFFIVESANITPLLLAWANDTWAKPKLTYQDYDAVSTVHCCLGYAQ